MKVKMSMVHLQEKVIPLSESKPTGLQIETITELAREDEREDICLFFRGEDLSVNGLPFLTRNHFRDKKGRRYIPAFSLITEGEEAADGLRLAFGTSDDSTKLSFFCQVEKNLFIDYPQGEYESNNTKGIWEFKYDNSPSQSSLGYLHPGYTNIFLLREDGSLYDHVRELFAFPSSVTLDEMLAMLRELISIRRELVILNDNNVKSTLHESMVDISMHISWHQVLVHIDKKMSKLLSILKRIDKRPYSSLKYNKKIVRGNTLKKIDENIIRQYVHEPGKGRFLIDTASDTKDIYEHRLIYNKLKSLKTYLHQQNEQYLDSIAEEKKSIYNQMESICDKEKFRENNEIQDNSIEERWGRYEQYIKSVVEGKREKTTKLFDEHVAKAFQEVATTYKKQEISFKKANITIELDNGGLCVLVKAIWESHRSNCKVDILNGQYDSTLLYGFRYISTDYARLSAVFDKLSELAEQDIVKHISVKGGMNLIQEGNGFYLNIYTIDKLFIGEESVEFSEDQEVARQKLKDIYVESAVSKKREGEKNLCNYGVAKELDTRLAEVMNFNKQDIFAKVLEKIDFMLKLPLFSEVTDRDEKWRMTQIFTNDYNYRQVYNLLYGIDKVYDFSFVKNEKQLVYNKMDKLYEYWVLAKLIQLLIIDQKWEAEDLAGPIEVINEYFEKKKYIDTKKISLQHSTNEGKLYLDLYYDTELKDSLRDMLPERIEKKSQHNVLELRPDYLFRVSKSQNHSKNDKIFILDAKYKKYSDFSKKYWLENELKGVCESKYLLAPKSDLGIDISVAFIVHPDNSSSGDTPNNFWGKYVTYDAAVDKRCGLSGKDATPPRSEGAFYLRPYLNRHKNSADINQSKENLSTYFKMIFEFYMGEWEICWTCGSKDVEKTTMYTEAGYRKYHLHCNKCGAFWVKNHCDDCHDTIIKHLMNYFVEKNRETWYLFCHSGCGTKESESDYHISVEELFGR